jgi:hypothetical protein
MGWTLRVDKCHDYLTVQITETYATGKGGDPVLGPPPPKVPHVTFANRGRLMPIADKRA